MVRLDDQMMRPAHGGSRSRAVRRRFDRRGCSAAGQHAEPGPATHTLGRPGGRSGRQRGRRIWFTVSLLIATLAVTRDQLEQAKLGVHSMTLACPSPPRGGVPGDRAAPPPRISETAFSPNHTWAAYD